MRPRPLACSTQAANVTIDLRDRVPSSGIGTACQYHKEQYQHFALSILSCPMQAALQIILSEPQILLEKLDQLSFQGSHEYLFVRTESFPFPFENLARSPNLDFFLTFRPRFPEA